MALSGQLSDLSLAELIEFFCNQRKSGRLKVAYELTPGYFYFDRGDLVDAKIGSLNGIEAIYYALTLANASFKFSPAFEPTRRTIHQPWTQVTLEGLRRLDEGIKPKAPFTEEGVSDMEDPDGVSESAEAIEYDSEAGMPLAMTVDSTASKGRSKVVYAGVAAAILALIAVAGIPAGWYSKGKAAVTVAEPAAPAPVAPAANPETEAASPAEQPVADPNSAEADAAAATGDANALAAKRAREAKEQRARMAEAAAAKQQAAAAANPTTGQPADAAKKPDAAKPAPKMVTVQVTYDEAGRVTQTSGGDGTAQRIARQKRFPAGKAGTGTVTIPIN